MGKGNLIVVIVLEYFDTSFVFSFPIGKRSSFSSFEYVCSPELVNGILSTMTPKFKNKHTYTQKLFLNLITFLGNVVTY